MKKLKRITRNGIAVALATAAGVAAALSPGFVISAIWTRDIRWTWTGLSSLGLAVILVIIGYILFDDEPEVPAR